MDPARQTGDNTAAPNAGWCSPGRVAVIGDVGGHFDELTACLGSLGCDIGERHIPDGLVVVQVGDLVHRGPDSDGVVAFVDTMLSNNPGRWLQLVGNHEAQYLFEPKFVWNETISPQSSALLRSWFANGAMRVAAHLRVDGVEVRNKGGVRTMIGSGDLVVTHAGVTFGVWCELGCPDAARLAGALNATMFDGGSLVWRPGSMLTRCRTLDAGPVWAEAGGELVGSWWQRPSPGFHQAHGHSSLFDWSRGAWRDLNMARLIGPSGKVDRVTRQTRVWSNGQVIWGVDPVHGRQPALSWAPLVLTGHAVGGPKPM